MPQINVRIVVGLLILVAGGAFAQTDSRFFQDADGYHGFGRAEASSAEAALRLARAAAIDQVFDSIEKDQLFRNLFIADWPEQIEQEVLSRAETNDGTFTAEVRVLIPVEPVNLTERSYEAQVTQLLDSAFSLLNNAQQKITDATAAENNLNNAEALALFNGARRDLRSAEVILEPIGNTSVLSGAGMTVSTIRQLHAAAAEQAEEGIARLNSIREEQIQDSGLKRTSESIQILADEIAEILGFADELQPLSPFYDLPSDELEGYLSEVRSRIDRLDVLSERLEAIGASIDDDAALLAQDISIALDDAEYSRRTLTRFRDELSLEIANPRLQRQEAARAWAEFGRSLLDGVGWFFLHEPLGVVSLRYNLPFVLNPGDGPSIRNGFEGHLRVEGALNRQGRQGLGIWLRTNARFAGDTVNDGTQDVGFSSFSQSVDAGLIGDVLLGVGFEWDWVRDVRVGDSTVPGRPLNRLMVHLGTVPQDAFRPDFLATLSYQLPFGSPPFGALYYINAGLDARLMIADVLTLDAGFRTSWFQSDAWVLGDPIPEGAALYDYLAYEIGWNFSAGINLPPPLTFGVGIRGDYYGRFDNQGLVGQLVTDHFGFHFYVGYTF